MIKKKVLLVCNDNPIDPLGIMYLIGNCDAKFDVVFVKDENDIRFIYKDFKGYDVVGFSTITGSHKLHNKLAEIVKFSNRKCITIMGGPHPTFFPKESLELNYIDYICIGEGVVAFDKFLKNKPTNNIINDISHYNGMLEPVVNLNKLKIDRELVYSIDERYNNPIRNFMGMFGCPYNCSYCIDGNTKILMKDFSSKLIKDIRIGDEIIGFDEFGTDKNRRKFKNTIVTNIFKTNKKAFKITLEDDREIICSGDHRWLTNRGWKHTHGVIRGGDELCRPYLTLKNKLNSLNIFLEDTKEESDDYKKGYLSGMIKGDACFKNFPIKKSKGKFSYYFRLVLKDIEGINITKEYLNYFDINLNNFLFDNRNGEFLNGIRCSNKDCFNKITNLIKFNDDPEFYRGFLAGFFDAEGSNTTAIRFYNTGYILIDFLKKCLDYYNFKYYISFKDGKNKILSIVSLQGGIEEKIRFFKLVNIKIKRKEESIIGKGTIGLVNIKEIIETDEYIDMYDITTTSRTFIANGVVSHNCFNNSYDNLYKHQDIKRIRLSDPELFIDEMIECADEYNTKFLYLQDDTFIVNKNWFYEVTNLIQDRVCLPYHCHVRCDLVTEEIVKQLKGTGCESVTFAVENADYNYRKNYLNRRMTNDQILNTAKLLHKYEIKFRIENMVGLPFNTLQDNINTMKLNHKCKPTIGWASLFQPFPNTELGDICKKHNLWDGDIDSINPSFFDTSSINIENKKEVERLQKIFSLAVDNKLIYWLTPLLIKLPLDSLYTKLYTKFKNNKYNKLYSWK